MEIGDKVVQIKEFYTYESQYIKVPILSKSTNNH